MKAFLIYEHPAWISDGELHRQLTNHKLVALSGKSSLIPYAKRDSWVLAAFEEGNESWMRYPCPLRACELRTEPQLQDKLWQAYLQVMEGYGQEVKRLLERGWKGPHEALVEKWQITGTPLGAKSIRFLSSFPVATRTATPPHSGSHRST
jgi:hypothetical protein